MTLQLRCLWPAPRTQILDADQKDRGSWNESETVVNFDFICQRVVANLTWVMAKKKAGTSGIIFSNDDNDEVSVVENEVLFLIES